MPAAEPSCRYRSYVAANDNQAVNSHLEADLFAAFDTLIVAKFRTTRRIQDCTAAVQRITDAAQIHFKHIARQQAAVPAADSKHAYVPVQSSSDDRTDRRIHAGGIAAAAEYTDCFLFKLHIAASSVWGNPPHFYSSTFLIIEDSPR